MRNILTYGTFDLFHYGHLKLIERARALGDHLTVAVSTDEFNAIKGKKCTYSYAHRAEIVAALRNVDRVIPEQNWEQKIEDIKKFNIDVFVIGDDWKGKFDELEEYCEVVYLPRTSNISTTDIKQNVHDEIKSQTK